MKFVMFEGDIYNKDTIVCVSLVPSEPSDKEVLVNVTVSEAEVNDAQYSFSSVAKAKEAVYNLFRSLNEG